MLVRLIVDQGGVTASGSVEVFFFLSLVIFMSASRTGLKALGNNATELNWDQSRLWRKSRLIDTCFRTRLIICLCDNEFLGELIFSESSVVCLRDENGSKNLSRWRQVSTVCLRFPQILFRFFPHYFISIYNNYKIRVFTYCGWWKFDFHWGLLNCFFYSDPICLLTSPHLLNEFIFTRASWY